MTRNRKANNALTSPVHGLIILPTVILYSRVLSRLALALDKRPDLLSSYITQASTDNHSTTSSTKSLLSSRETLPEKAANTIRQAFVTCLNDRSGTSPTGYITNPQTSLQIPEAKKVGIYKLANLCLKILFHCGKFYNAEQIITNIYNQSPPLNIYPRGET